MNKNWGCRFNVSGVEAKPLFVYFEEKKYVSIYSIAVDKLFYNLLSVRMDLGNLLCLNQREEICKQRLYARSVDSDLWQRSNDYFAFHNTGEAQPVAFVYFRYAWGNRIGTVYRNFNGKTVSRKILGLYEMFLQF